MRSEARALRSALVMLDESNEFMFRAAPLRVACRGFAITICGICTSRRDAMAKRRNTQEQLHEQVAGNGLLHRRFFLQSGAAMAGAAAALATRAARQPSARLAAVDAEAGRAVLGLWRALALAHQHHPHPRRGTPPPGREGAGSSRTPLQMLEGTITPAGLHYERHHNGVPDIDPDKHELMIHGMVRQPLVFNLNSLLRYPMETRIHYVECAGNSGGISGAAEPQQVNAGVLHGLLSCSEWTGVKLSDAARRKPGSIRRPRGSSPKARTPPA